MRGEWIESDLQCAIWQEAGAPIHKVQIHTDQIEAGCHEPQARVLIKTERGNEWGNVSRMTNTVFLDFGGSVELIPEP